VVACRTRWRWSLAEARASARRSVARSRSRARVVVNGLPEDPIEDVVAAIVADGGTAMAFAGDVAHEDTARACVDAAVARHGALDVLVNNAGVLLVNAETDDMPTDAFDEQLRCNVRSAFLMSSRRRPSAAAARWTRSRMPTRSSPPTRRAS
jgi:NAD(P)-dependent dehydrogenase (short-subunit alcohol dehydrogenase family)